MGTKHRLMLLHVEALYTHDAAGNIVSVNEYAGTPAPRFFLGRTDQELVLRYRHDVDEATRRDLEELSRSDTALTQDADPSAAAAASLPRYAALLRRAGPVRRTHAGPAFAFHREPPEPGAGVVLVTAENAELLHPLLPAWVPDVERSAPLFARVVDGQAVAVCASVRITPNAHEAGVQTAPAFRGRGHAVQVVAAWARAVRAAGVEPLYSTAWENAASRGVARRLGLELFGSDLHLT